MVTTTVSPESVSDASKTVDRFSRVLVGIPAYNEAVGIGSTVLATTPYAGQVVVVDDGSSDDTARIAQLAGATVIKHETNQGKGAAIRTLINYARSVEYDTLVLLDGDGQHCSDDIPDVVGPVLTDGIDLVIGSRYLKKDTDEETPFYRRCGQRVLDTLTTASTGAMVTDSQSGFRALSPAAIESLSLTTDGMAVESEMIDDAIRKDLQIQEVPIEVRYDGVDGQTYNPLQHGLAVMSFLLKLIRDRHPIVFFGLPGGLLAGSGLVTILWTIQIYNQTGMLSASGTLLGGLATIIGVLGIFCGFILNRIAHMIVELREVP